MIVSMKINQKKAKLPFGIIKCLKKETRILPLDSYSIINTVKISQIPGHMPNRDEKMRDPRAF